MIELHKGKLKIKDPNPNDKRKMGSGSMNEKNCKFFCNSKRVKKKKLGRKKIFIGTWGL